MLMILGYVLLGALTGSVGLALGYACVLALLLGPIWLYGQSRRLTHRLLACFERKES